MSVTRAASRIVSPVVCALMLFVLLLGRVDGLPALAASPSQIIQFNWAFCRLVEDASDVRLEPIKHGAVLKSGDKIKMMIELRKKCFVYVIHQDSQGEVSILFPYTLDQFKTDYQPSKKYYVPAGEAWFQLDEHPGTETFFLLASDQRMVDIEYLFDRYKSADPAKKMRMAGLMIAAIRDIDAHSQEVVASAETSARGEKVTRGFERAKSYDPSNVAGLADEISASEPFSRTITIEHK